MDSKKSDDQIKPPESEVEGCDYRSFVDMPELYDYLGALQFNLLTALGLREHHYFLEIGCGSLRAGRLFIPYLLPDRYFGIEPERWLIDEAISNEIGQDILKIKRPIFNHSMEFTLRSLGPTFDFILAQSIFTHASSYQIQTCLHEAEQVMKPTSLFIANFSEGERDYDGDEWVYPGFVQYTYARISEIAGSAGLQCGRINWTKPPSNQEWIVIAKPGYENMDALLEPYAELKALRICEERLEFAMKQIERIFGKAKQRLVDRSDGSSSANSQPK